MVKVKSMNEYKKDKKNKNKRNKLIKLKKILKRVSLVLILFLTILSNMMGEVLLSKLSYEVNSLKTNLRKEEIRLGEAKEKVNIDMSIKEIETFAREELGMDYPTKDQIRYIIVDN
ncbi:MAG: hypothetical protein R3Y64_06160 [Peptostreptococcaceae bacterium]